MVFYINEKSSNVVFMEFFTKSKTISTYQQLYFIEFLLSVKINQLFSGFKLNFL